MLEEINLNEWVLSGEGAEGESFNHKTDNTLLLKLYRENFNSAEVEKEQTIAKIVYDLGITTPEPGKIVTCGNRKGIIFKRIPNKRSFCRVVGQQPERLKEMAQKLAEEAKILHTTKINSSVELEDYRQTNINFVNRFDIKPKRKQMLLDFINAQPAPNCYIHGDFHFGNIITNDVKNYYIDLSRFGLGTPDYDISMLFFVAYYTPDKLMRRNFHITSKQAVKFCKEFIKCYYPDPQERKKHIEVIWKWTVFKCEFVNLLLGDPLWFIFCVRGHLKSFLFERRYLKA